MRFWWVNHSQTYKVELKDGYIWSPNKNNNGTTNQTYLNLTSAKPHDIIFSYAKRKVKAVGIISQGAIDWSRPPNFGKAGDQWSKDGWLVLVQWVTIGAAIEPKQHMETIAPLLPPKYSPLRPDGNGNQGVYLAGINEELGNYLMDLIAKSDPSVDSRIQDLFLEMKENEEVERIQKKDIPPTKKTLLIEARVGQGAFRLAVIAIENCCRITNLSGTEFLVASHIKPWRDSTDEEKLDGNNGLLLSPHVDKLFDKGYISFEDDGRIMIAHSNLVPILSKWNLDFAKNVGGFTSKQQAYLKYHREVIFAKKQKLLVQATDSDQ